MNFQCIFFQTHWEICEKEVTLAVLCMLKGEDNLREINQIFIVLKGELGKFRPICLCNVIYKIASKLLANRLKVVLPEIIAEIDYR
jgi:hypothetical protein